jgi:phage head maturation protease
MKRIIKLTDKYMAKLGLPAELLAGLPEENRCVKRMSIDAADDLKFSDDPEDKYVRGVISTVDPDADGDVVLPEGLVWDRYVKNPVVLFNHDLNSPVGLCDEVITEAGGHVRARTRFGTTPEAQKVYQLMKDKVLRTFSIGFVPMECVERGNKGFENALRLVQEQYPDRIDGQKVGRIVQKALIVEYSVVTIPANENAVVTEMKGLGLSITDSAVEYGPKEPVLPVTLPAVVQIKRLGLNLDIKRMGTASEEDMRILYRNMWGV